MVSDEVGMKLHDRATRGQTLTAEEQALLQAWYDQGDRAEAEMLARNQAVWQTRIQETLAQIAQLVRMNEELAAQNDELRAEIAMLRQLLEKRRSPQPA
jgi:predicted RNase H-like nuclease (RuvC/YqgF family)